MKPFNIFVSVVVIAILGGFVFFHQRQPNTAVNATQEYAAGSLQMDLENYLDYTPTSLVNAQLRGKTVLFFAATTWCQTCSHLEEEIIARQAEIPSDYTILKVDYDNDDDTTQQWSVTSQHTLIELDSQGQEIKRWVGGGFDTLLNQLGTT